MRYFLNKTPKPKLPCKVTLIRIAPRFLDVDNLWAAQKICIDVIADWLIPGLAAGQADSDKRIQWTCEQKKGAARQYDLEVDIMPYTLLE